MTINTDYSNYKSTGIDKLTDFIRGRGANKVNNDPKKMELGPYLAGLMPAPGTQTMASNWNK